MRQSLYPLPIVALTVLLVGCAPSILPSLAKPSADSPSVSAPLPGPATITGVVTRSLLIQRYRSRVVSHEGKQIPEVPGAEQPPLVLQIGQNYLGVACESDPDVWNGQGAIHLVAVAGHRYELYCDIEPWAKYTSVFVVADITAGSVEVLRAKGMADTYRPRGRRF